MSKWKIKAYHADGKCLEEFTIKASGELAALKAAKAELKLRRCNPKDWTMKEIK